MSQVIVRGLECVWPAQRCLGEGPWWSEPEQALYWVDIKHPAFLRYRPADGTRNEWPSPEPISAFAPKVGGGFVGAFASGLYAVMLGPAGTKAERTLIARPMGHADSDRFNDGKCHSDGSFWAGTMDDTEKEVRGWFYRLDARGNLTRVSGPYMVCNGPAFSPDGKLAYLTDSAARTIYCLDLSVVAAGPEVMIRLDEADGYPDGMTIDTDGRLWIACWDGGKVLCVEPSGRRVAEIRLPVSRPTSCAFGGKDFDTLFITSASYGLSFEDLQAQSMAGGLLAAKLDGAIGLPTAQYGV